MKKHLQLLCVMALFLGLGFGFSTDANSETTVYQELPCYKKKGNAMPGAGFLYCPKFIITLSCNYKYDYMPSDEIDDRDECNFTPQ